MPVEDFRFFFLDNRLFLPSLFLSLFLFRFRTLLVLLSPSSRVRQPAYLSSYNRFIYLLPRCENELFPLSPLQISPASSAIGMALVHLRDEDSERNYVRDMNVLRGNTIRQFLQLANLFHSLLLVACHFYQIFYQTRLRSSFDTRLSRRYFAKARRAALCQIQ